MKKYSLRIVKKSKEGITLKGKNTEPKTFSWEEFNSSYDIDKDDKYLAVIKPEYVEKFEENLKEAEEVITNAVVSMLILKAGKVDAHEKLVHLTNLGSSIDKLKELTGCTSDEARDIIFNRAFQASLAVQSGDFKEKKETPKEYKARKEREKQTIPTERATSKLGDLEELQKLKESFKK